MKIKILIGILLVLIAINLGTIGTYLYLQLNRDKNIPHWDQSRRSHFPPNHRPEMKLDKQQRHQLRNLLQEFQQENQDIRNQIWELERTTFDLLQQENIPQNQVNQNLKQLSDYRLKLMTAAVEKMIKAKSFLNPEQQKHFFDFIMESRPAPPFRREPAGGPPAPPDFDEMYEMD